MQRDDRSPHTTHTSTFRRAIVAGTAVAVAIVAAMITSAHWSSQAHANTPTPVPTTAAPKPTPDPTSEVKKAKAILHLMAMAVESYKIDNDTFPTHTLDRSQTLLAGTASMNDDPTVPFPRLRQQTSLATLTTPIAYVSVYPPDPFRKTDPEAGFAYFATSTSWIVYSPGPDGTYDITDPAALFDPATGAMLPQALDKRYDPTNGSAKGDLMFTRNILFP